MWAPSVAPAPVGVKVNAPPLPAVVVPRKVVPSKTATVARTVSETEPESPAVAKLQAPLPLAVVLPRTVLPLRTWTVEPASAVPASARLVSSVVPPLSFP